MKKKIVLSALTIAFVLTCLTPVSESNEAKIYTFTGKVSSLDYIRTSSSRQAEDKTAVFYNQNKCVIIFNGRYPGQWFVDNTVTITYDDNMTIRSVELVSEK